MSTPYTSPIVVEVATTLRAIALAQGVCDSNIAEATYYLTYCDLSSATPTFSPPGGSYCDSQSVTIQSTSPGAEIRYTMDGSTPTASSTLYTGPVQVSNSLVLKAYADAPNYCPSSVGTAIYTLIPGCLDAEPPTIIPNGGVFCGPLEIALATTEPNGVIVYTLDGSLPATGNGQIYTGPFTITAAATVNAVTTAPGKTSSNPSTATFVINLCYPSVQPVSISPGTTTSDNDIGVTLSTNTSGATICYTTDGSQPVCSSSGTCQSGQTYDGLPVAITATGTIVTARGCKDGFDASVSSNATYTLKGGDVQFDPIAGAVPSGTAVKMTTTTQSATIRYATDGTDPTCTTGTAYSGPISISADTTFRAIACKQDYVSSDVTAASYVISN